MITKVGIPIATIISVIFVVVLLKYYEPMEFPVAQIYFERDPQDYHASKHNAVLKHRHSEVSR